MTGLNIVVGVAGGIAAYKACHLVRFFTERGHSVTVVPTESALKFVGAATFEALSGNPVSTSVFDAVDQVQHVRVGQAADLVVIAPATADLMARMAAGRADDLLTATCLVATCPVVVAPAMHTEMWWNPATQDNVATFRRRAPTVLEPAHGRLTGTDSGPGRLLEPGQIGEAALAVYAGAQIPRDLEGRKVLITAGGTQENLDPVRFIGNHSSGRQGFALAEIAAHRGAEVTVVAANTDDLPNPAGGTVVHRVLSARDMADKVGEVAGEQDVIIMAAAVADVRPAHQAAVKLKKAADSQALGQLELVENPDILAGLTEIRSTGIWEKTPVIVGFAAETGDDGATPLDHAVAKLQRKGCDLLMCNEVGAGKVFGQDTNSGWMVFPDGRMVDVLPGSKLEVAAQIMDEVVELMPPLSS